MIDHDQQDDRDEVRRLIAARAPELSADEIAEAFAALPDDRAPIVGSVRPSLGGEPSCGVGTSQLRKHGSFADGSTQALATTAQLRNCRL